MVNFNNMIPVKKETYKVIYFNKKNLRNIFSRKYQELLKDQLSWLSENYMQIMSKSYKLYNLYNTKRLSKNIMDRCCNFKLLEEKCEQYHNDIVSVG